MPLRTPSMFFASVVPAGRMTEMLTGADQLAPWSSERSTVTVASGTRRLARVRVAVWVVAAEGEREERRAADRQAVECVHL